MIPVLKVFKVQRVTTALMELPVRKAILVRLVLKVQQVHKVLPAPKARKVHRE